MLKVSEVTKTYKQKKVLDNVSFCLESGKTLGLAGHNGSGKSTLLSIIAQLTVPASGEITFNGSSIFNNKEFMQKSLGYVPQQDALLSGLSVRQTLAFWQQTYSLKKRRLFETGSIEELMGLKEIARKKVETLSGGMQKRLCIALALLHKPELLLLDESFSPLDAEYKNRLRQFLQSYKNNGGMIIYCSHETDEMLKAADDILVLQGGKTAFKGSAAEFNQNENNFEELLRAPVNCNS